MAITTGILTGIITVTTTGTTITATTTAMGITTIMRQNRRKKTPQNRAVMIVQAQKKPPNRIARLAIARD